jgi:hypothetical protein
LVAVIVALTISLALFGVWARGAVQQHRRMRNEQFQQQAVRLAEAGVRRAIARRVADAEYSQERWQIPASDLNSTHEANVQIRVTQNDNPARLRFEATAEYPAAAVRRAQITKRIEIPNSALGDEP